MQVSTIGIDLAKNVFQAHGVDCAGKVALVRQLRRKQMMEFFGKLEPCLIGMEACATGHYWARELTKLGHTVRLMPPAYVKAYVRRQKNDMADAAAICLKSGNAVILRGGKEAAHSSRALVDQLRAAATEVGVPIDAVQLVDTPDREAVRHFLGMADCIDVAIPRRDICLLALYAGLMIVVPMILRELGPRRLR